MAAYDTDFVGRLHAVWGDGFLSPGGPEEVSEIVAELSLAGARVLDLGCGSGGPARTLAERFGADVVAADVQADLLSEVAARAAAAGLSDRIETALIAPGPLPFGDAGFDVVFSKDALIHVADKPAIYREIRRVLRPGGAFAASDWLASETAGDAPEMRRYLDAAHLDFSLATAADCEAALRAAGFEAVRSRDRNGWYAAQVAEELRRLEGPLREEIVAASGAEAYGSWMVARRALAEAVICGTLRPTHLFGRAPR